MPTPQLIIRNCTMMIKALRHSFVKFIPERLDEGVLYVSIDYWIAPHNCACGCGNKVITPITPTDWELTLNGESISLNPSIGNWSFDCQSHYWVKCSKIEWAGRWSREEIVVGREKDRVNKATYLITNDETSNEQKQTEISVKTKLTKGEGFWKRFCQLLKF